MAELNQQQVIDYIKGISVLELSQLAAFGMYGDEVPAAGIITATTTKTGLGPQVAALLVGGAKALAGDPTLVIALTAIFAAVAPA